MLNVENQLLLADRAEGGFTYTLASRLGAMLAEAEARFGERDTTYTILGIEFNDLGYPQIWYPNARQHIIIQLASECLQHPLTAYFQLAHECIHLLDPTGGVPKANVLEEGLAMSFQRSYMKTVFQADMEASLSNYADARVKVDELLALDPNVIRILRASGKKLPFLTAADIVAACPGASAEMAESLVAPFVTFAP